MAKLYFRYGAMGSSKTANAVMVQYNYRERGQQVLMLKPKLENRDGATIVRSRCGLEAQCRFVEELPTLPLDGIACVIVDEAHFLTSAQVRMLVDIVDERDIPVICYGLRTDFRGELFEGSRELLCWADTIEEIKTVCWCGRKATFNARVQDGRIVLILCKRPSPAEPPGRGAFVSIPSCVSPPCSDRENCPARHSSSACGRG